MSKIKLVITDVDGTLVTTEKALRPSAVAAVRRLHDAGIALFVTSGLAVFLNLRHVFDRIGAPNDAFDLRHHFNHPGSLPLSSRRAHRCA